MRVDRKFTSILKMKEAFKIAMKLENRRRPFLTNLILGDKLDSIAYLLIYEELANKIFPLKLNYEFCLKYS
jgi:hypothetical protein